MRKDTVSGRFEEGRKLLILRTAVDGTGLLDNHWKLTDDLFLRMMELTRTALTLNPENRLTALLWHQGKTNASNHASYEIHYSHLMPLLTTVRAEFGAPDLPFGAGDFVHHWKNDNIDICLWWMLSAGSAGTAVMPDSWKRTVCCQSAATAPESAGVERSHSLFHGCRV